MTGRPIHEQFDYICGVSTGATIALMVGVFRIPLSEAEGLYKEFSKEIFNRSRVAGTSGLLKCHAYYDTEFYQTMIK